MSRSLRVLLVGGPMYDPLYTRLAEFEEREGLRVETVVAPTHPDLNGRFLRPNLDAHQIRPEPDSVANPARRRPGR